VTKPIAPLSVVLPPPPERYDPRDQREARRLVELAFQRAFPSPTRVLVSGSRGGNAALASLITALESLGLIEDGTS
jgi:hypothetical protein